MDKKRLTPEEEINEGNKLVAAFMGCYGDTHWAGGTEVYRYGFKDTHITDRWHESKFIDETPYHSSWDWLMPSWGKLSLLLLAKGSFEIIEEFKNAVVKNDISAAWGVVLKGVKLVNE